MQVRLFKVRSMFNSWSHSVVLKFAANSPHQVQQNTTFNNTTTCAHISRPKERRFCFVFWSDPEVKSMVCSFNLKRLFSFKIIMIVFKQKKKNRTLKQPQIISSRLKDIISTWFLSIKSNFNHMSHNMQKMSCNPTSLSSAENLFPLFREFCGCSFCVGLPISDAGSMLHMCVFVSVPWWGSSCGAGGVRGAPQRCCRPAWWAQGLQIPF